MKRSYAPQTLRHSALAAIALSVLVSAPACDESQPPSETLIEQNAASDRMDWMATASLGASNSCEHALEQLQDNVRTEMLLQVEQVRRQMIDADGMGGFFGGGLREDVALAESASSADEGAVGGMSRDNAAAPSDVSETNVQVVGVDEADLVKTDAEFIYTLSGKDLVITAAWPADDMVEVGRVAVPGAPHSLYLRDDQVIVLSHSYRMELSADERRAQGDEGEYYDAYDWHDWQSLTLITTIEVTNPASPTITNAQAFEGYLSATRRIDADLYLVQNTWHQVQGIRYWPDVDWDAPLNQQLAALGRMVAENLQVIDALTLDA